MSYTEVAAVGNTNGTTEVELVAAPTGSTIRTIYSITFYNPDTITRDVSVKESGTT